MGYYDVNTRTSAKTNEKVGTIFPTKAIMLRESLQLTQRNPESIYTFF